MSQKNQTQQLSVVGKLLDLDSYREQRISEGTWPPTLESQVEFFSRFKKKDKKSA